MMIATHCKSGTAVVDDDGQCEKARSTSIPKTVNKVKSLSTSTSTKSTIKMKEVQIRQKQSK